MTKFVTPFNGRRVIGVIFSEPTMTKQAPANEVNINTIMSRYMRATGLSGDDILEQLDELYFKQPQGDATAWPDFDTAQNMISDVTKLFESLPSHIRERFGNTPSLFLKFMSDDSNMEEAVKLGLVVKKETAPADLKPAETVKPVATQTGEASS